MSFTSARKSGSFRVINASDPFAQRQTEAGQFVSASAVTPYPSSRSACSMPPCRSPTVFIFPRSTPIVTSVCAISGDKPVTITVATLRAIVFCFAEGAPLALVAVQAGLLNEVFPPPLGLELWRYVPGFHVCVPTNRLRNPALNGSLARLIPDGLSVIA